MDNRKPPPQPTATAENKFRDGDDNETPGNALGIGIAQIAATRKHKHSISIPHEIQPESTPAERGKKEQEDVLNDLYNQEIQHEKKRPAEEEDMLQVYKAAGDDSSLFRNGEEIGKTESSTRPSAIDTVSSIRLNIGSIKDPAGMLEQIAKLDIPQPEKGVVTALVQQLQKEWDRKILTPQQQRDADLKAVVRGELDWNEVNPTPDEYRGSRGLFITAFNRGIVESNITFRESARDFVADYLQCHTCPWTYVPKDLKNDLEFCRSLLCPHYIRRLAPGCRHIEDYYDWCRTAAEVFDRHRETLFSDRDVWKKIFEYSSSNDGSPARELFLFYMKQRIDPDFIPEAITECPQVLRSIDQVLHEPLVRELVIADRVKLFFLRRPFIDQFPDFFVDQFGALESEDLDRVHDHDPSELLFEIPRSIWTDHPNLVNTWIEVGLPRLDEQCDAFVESEWDERDMLLWIAQNGARKYWRVKSFEFMHVDLRGDVEFIRSAMEFDPAVLIHSDLLDWDRERGEISDLHLWAMSDPHFFDLNLQYSFGTDNTTLVEDINTVVTDLRMQQTFVRVFLVAGRHQRSLGLLGDPAYLKSIRDYAGIACGNKLLRCRQALATAKSVLESRRVDIPDSWNM